LVADRNRRSASSFTASATRGTSAGVPEAAPSTVSHWPDSVQIHPTAIVDPNATLGEGVVVGPFCTVGGEVTLGDRCKLGPGAHIFGHSRLGSDNTLLAGAIIGSEHAGATVIGDRNTFGHNSLVGVLCQDLKYKGDECFLVMGSNNDIREAVQIHRSSMPDLCTVVGNSNLIMGGCHVAHDCVVGSRNIMANNTLLAGHVRVGHSAVLGGAVAVCPFCEIGSYAFLAGGSMVEGDVPAAMRGKGDRVVLQGVNFEGLKRNGYTKEEITRTQRAASELFKDGVGTGDLAAAVALAERAERMLRSGEYGEWEAALSGSTSPFAGLEPEPGICTTTEPIESQLRSTNAVRVEPAVQLLATVVLGRSNQRSPGPCGWRRSGDTRVDDLEGEVRRLTKEVEALKARLGES